MTKQQYAKVVDGEIVKLAIKDSPESLAASDGGPVWRPYVKEDMPSYNALSHVLTVTEVIEQTQVVRRGVVTEKDLADVKGALTEDINREAQALIIAYTGQPDLLKCLARQNNWKARGIELLERRVINGEYTTEEQAEVDALHAHWVAIGAIRAASNTTNTEIDEAATVAEAVSAHAAVDWPV